MLPTKDYSRNKMAIKYLAPAKPYSRALLLIIEITLIINIAGPSNFWLGIQLMRRAH
jgi:hypothetical protein